jgi:hypothetical protein
LGTEPVRVPHRATDDATQHIATLLVRRDDAITHEERHGARVLSEDAQSQIVVGARAVASACRGFGSSDQGTEDVDVEDRIDTLEHHEVALEPRAGVDAGLPERGERTVGLGIELHEHEVPDFDVAVLGAARGTATLAEAFAEVPEDLRRRPAGPRVGHAPEVLLAHPLDALLGQPDDVAPDRGRLVIGFVDGDPEPLEVQLEDVAVKPPRPRDGLSLEVVAEAEVPEHLEEAEMAVRPPDVIQVVVLATGAHALLDRGRSRVRRLLLADEVRLERDHPRHREQQRRIVRNQAGRLDPRVIALDEVAEEGAA